MKKNDQETPQINGYRRRLTQAGLAVPAVLGTLASRQVLGADAYNCTPSGQVSGNVSRPGAVVCSNLGTSPAAWSTAATWPTPYVKGAHNPIQNPPGLDPKNWPPVLNHTDATLFKGVFGDVAIFKYIPANIGSVPHSCKSGDTYVSNGIHTGQCKVGANTYYPSFTYTPIGGSDIITSSDSRWGGQILTGSDGNTYNIDGISPTLLEVLSSSYSTDLFVFAQAAIATLLSAKQSYPSFPISPADVIAMFNATYNGTGLYNVNDKVSWNRSQVLAYFQSLYM